MTVHIPDMTIRSNRKEGQLALIIHNCQHSGVISNRGASHFCKSTAYYSVFPSF